MDDFRKKAFEEDEWTLIIYPYLSFWGRLNYVSIGSRNFKRNLLSCQQFNKWYSKYLDEWEKSTGWINILAHSV